LKILPPELSAGDQVPPDTAPGPNKEYKSVVGLFLQVLSMLLFPTKGACSTLTVILMLKLIVSP
jgi:hypothetical protein